MEEALEKIPHNLPDLVLSDIGLPGMDGISGIAILKRRHTKYASYACWSKATAIRPPRMSYTSQ